ncbi:MAG: low molecular weight phosphotyrosine protein phosphatase [Chloroflexi bacterium]|nr:low molecular weight phosphotyrosine protein phosphatase [Chloroflexota bacterium]
MIKVLFVCHANFCRSPMAEGIFNMKIEQAGLSDMIWADSAGISSIFAGSPPHKGTLEILASLGINYEGVSRPFTRKDFQDFDYILAMDTSNLRAIRSLAPADNKARIAMLMDYASGATQRDLEDPCFTERFHHVYRLIDDATDGLLLTIRMENELV